VTGSIGNVEKMSLKFTFKNINRVALLSSIQGLQLVSRSNWPLKSLLKIRFPTEMP